MKDNYDISKLKNKKRKKSINSRKKGNNFELKIANLLNERFQTEEFSRTPGSGAFATSHKLPTHMLAEGDLIIPTNFRFCIEAKKGYDKTFTLPKLLQQDSDLWEILNKAEASADKIDKVPMVIWGKDRGKIYAFIPDTLYEFEVCSHISIFGWNIYLLEDILATDDRNFFDAWRSS